ncbi:MAG: shikimate dehydrogenase [Gemmatimonadaceae bacterium]|nr:shikimate dehydrogenase [Gemmatimonadaceae bacterium]
MPMPTRLVLLGHPVAHSLSPTFQNAALQAAHLAPRYEAVDVSYATLGATLRSLVAEGAAGNVTIPHKERVAALCDVLTPLATRLGAVNTWWTSDGALHGDNTDVGGFDDAVAALLGELPRGAIRVAVLGAGGSARAVVAAVGGWPAARLAIWGRTPARAAPLLALGPAGATTVEELVGDAVRGADLIVNTTPVGMRDDQLPVEPRLLPVGAACLDLVYRRDSLTPFVRAARAQGRRADDGLRMLVSQGARSWMRWFGRAADGDAMWHAACEASTGRS